MGQTNHLEDVFYLNLENKKNFKNLLWMKKSQLLNTYEKVTSSKYRVVLETTSYMNVASD